MDFDFYKKKRSVNSDQTVSQLAKVTKSKDANNDLASAFTNRCDTTIKTTFLSVNMVDNQGGLH